MSIPRTSSRTLSRIPERAEQLDIKNIFEARQWFEVLQTGKDAQTAVMRLVPGQASSDNLSVHRSSDQVLFVVEGEIFAEVGDGSAILHTGDTILVTAGQPHRFTNQSGRVALTFNVYSPPEYPFE